jgi:hypothetical protein
VLYWTDSEVYFTSPLMSGKTLLGISAQNASGTILASESFPPTLLF